MKRRAPHCFSALKAMSCAASVLAAASFGAAPASATPHATPYSFIDYVMVIELENESFGATFGASSPAVYLNKTLLPQGELITNYFATGHVSLDNYISQVSGQESTVSTNNDCLNLASLTSPPAVGSFNNVTPGTDADPSYIGQVVGDGCVYPAPTSTTHGAQTIGDQVDAAYGQIAYHPHDPVLWREYAEDMGNDIARDHGDPDTLGIGTDCAHPAINGNDLTNTAEAADQYADRHAPFAYFHSVIDDQRRCDAHVVPLGKLTVGTGGSQDVFTGHLFRDLQHVNTTPHFMWVTPNLCDDGHDASCAGTNVEGGKTGGLVGADLWLKHYMPMIFASPAYQSGRMLVVITFDEGATSDARACPNANQSTCGSPTGPNVSNPGYSSVLGLFGLQTPPTALYQYAGGGQVGAALFNKRFIAPGTVNTTGVYNHYSALRSYEDLLHITTGGDDGQGHLGYAATPGLQHFGTDVFNRQ